MESPRLVIAQETLDEQTETEAYKRKLIFSNSYPQELTQVYLEGTCHAFLFNFQLPLSYNLTCLR